MSTSSLIVIYKYSSLPLKKNITNTPQNNNIYLINKSANKWISNKNKNPKPSQSRI